MDRQHRGYGGDAVNGAADGGYAGDYRARRTEYLFHGEILEESRRITSKANLWADLGSRGQMAAAVQEATACGLRGTREVAVCPEWRDTSALCAAARGREKPAPRTASCKPAGICAGG